MDFELKPEQEQLREMLRRYVRQDYGFEARRRILAMPEGQSPEVWHAFAELGLLGIGIPEEHGGMGGDSVDTFVVMEALGQGLVVEPYLSTVVLCGGLVRDAGSVAQKQSILPAIAGGDLRMALAHGEHHGRYELDQVAASARRGAKGYTLDAAKAVVLDGAGADNLVVSARTAGKPGDPHGISLFLVDATARGVRRVGYATRDGHRAADIVLDAVEVEHDALLGEEGEGLPVLERAIDGANAALCAEAVGCMDALNELTLEYLKTRKQFGVAIGTFQVLKHRMADMFIAAAQARSMACLAAIRAQDSDRARRRHAIAAARALVGRSSRFVGQQAVQLHGGMGVTDELAVSHYFRRLTAINSTFGDADHHLASFSDQMLSEGSPQASVTREGVAV